MLHDSVGYQGKKKRPIPSAAEQAEHAGRTPQPGVPMGPRDTEQLSASGYEYSPTEYADSGFTPPVGSPIDHTALHEAAVKRVEEKEKKTSIVNSLLAAPLPGAPANIGASSQYATPNEEGKLEVKLPSTLASDKSKPEKPEPLSTEEAIKAFEEQGTPSHMAAKLAANPAVVQQLEEAIAGGFGNTPHPTEGPPSGSEPASTAIISSDPSNKAHQDLLAAAHNKHREHKPKITSPIPGLEPEQEDVLNTVLSVGKRMHASPKEMLSAVETGLVESNLKNLDYGDASSEGWRQELSTEYPEPTNVEKGAENYFEEAKTDPSIPGGGGEAPGELAQTVQGSAYPERYEEHRSEAEALLKAAEERGFIQPGTTTQGPVKVPKGARKYFENEGAHLRFVPTFAHHLEKLAKLSGEPVAVNEGFRTEPEQEDLYQAYLNGEGSLAAEPGTSEHEKGLAADIQLTDHQRELLSAAGLDLPVPGEDWHVQLSEPNAIAQAAEESAVPVPGVASSFDPSLLPSAPTSSEGLSTSLAGETSTSPAAALLDQHNQESAPQENKPSLAMQLLFGGGENETPVNALLNSPLPALNSGISEELSNEELLKLLLGRA